MFMDSTWMVLDGTERGTHVHVYMYNIEVSILSLYHLEVCWLNSILKYCMIRSQSYG